MKLIHYLQVALHFNPWERAFWLGLMHDSIEDGWLTAKTISLYTTNQFASDVIKLSRAGSCTYAEYIQAISQASNDVQRVKIADLLVNYKRATPSLRKRYAKALLTLAKG